MTDRPSPSSAIPLTPAVFHIMLALADGNLHGYGIKLAVRELSGGRIQLGSGTLYRSLQKAFVDGLVERIEDVAGPRDAAEPRVDYRLTKFGREVAEAEAERLALLVEAAMNRRLLPGWRMHVPQIKSKRGA